MRPPGQYLYNQSRLQDRIYVGNRNLNVKKRKTTVKKRKIVTCHPSLLCKTKDRIKAGYALRDIRKTIGISDYNWDRLCRISAFRISGAVSDPGDAKEVQDVRRGICRIPDNEAVAVYKPDLVRPFQADADVMRRENHGLAFFRGQPFQNVCDLMSSGYVQKG